MTITTTPCCHWGPGAGVGFHAAIIVIVAIVAAVIVAIVVAMDHDLDALDVLWDV